MRPVVVIVALVLVVEASDALAQSHAESRDESHVSVRIDSVFRGVPRYVLTAADGQASAADRYWRTVTLAPIMARATLDARGLSNGHLEAHRVGAARDGAERGPEVVAPHQPALEHDGAEGNGPHALHDAHVATALLDDPRLHRGFEARHLGEGAAAHGHRIALRRAADGGLHELHLEAKDMQRVEVRTRAHDDAP
jgi:hypothetical protein